MNPQVTEQPVTTTPPKKKSQVGQLLLLLFLVALAVVFFAMRSGKSVKGLVAGPSTIVDERVELTEGEFKVWSITSPATRKIEIDVKAQPRAIDVITMDAPSYAEFKKATQKLFGGKYHQSASLSSESVTATHLTGFLSQGQWYVVAMMPSKSILVKDKTQAQIKVVGY